MKNKLLKLLLISSLSFFIGQETLAATCSWTEQIRYPAVLPTPSITGCPANSNLAGDDKCLAPKPADGVTNPGQISGQISHVCCCAIPASSQSEPKFKMPDFVFQVPIPGLAKLSTVNCTTTCEIPWISEYIFAIYTYGLTVVGIIAVLILMAAGLLWIVSGGDSGKINKAKSMIAGSITGLLLMVSMNLLLSYINPELIKKKAISLDYLTKISLESLAETRNSSKAETFKNANCASDDELAKGVEFYATGYYKPAYNPSDPNFLCIVAMQCSCPNGRDLTQNCDNLYGKTFPNYHPCKPFDADTKYCNMTASGSEPQIGDIAGPKCSNLPFGSYVCFKGSTYHVTDSGGGIQGKRIDIWSGNNLQIANSQTGVGILTKGKCQ
ncbi:MAG: hypothetical protein WCK59_00945 [Candidatus Falkowbacteria bacterium]